MYLMTGKAPKNMDSDPITGDIDWFKNLNISDSFAEILSKMLEVAVKNRYKTAEEALQALDIENHVDSLSESMLYPAMGDTPNTSLSNRTGVSSSRRSMPSSRAKGSRSRASRRREGRSTSVSRSARNNTKIGSRSSVGKSTAFNKVPKALPKPTKYSAEELLKAYSSGRKDFGSRDLSMQDLQKADLSEIRLHNSKLVKTNLQGADLNKSDFSNCDLRQAMLRNADLTKSFFKSSNLEGIDLRGANLSYVNFKRVKLQGANCCGANLSNTNLTPEQLEQVKTNWMTIMPSGKRGFW